MTGKNGTHNRNVGICEAPGKLKYPTRKDARRSSKSRSDAADVAPYVCTSCGHWHLGHLPRGVVEGTVARSEIFTVHDDPLNLTVLTRALIAYYRRGRTDRVLAAATRGQITAHTWRAWANGHERIPGRLTELVADTLGAPIEEIALLATHSRDRANRPEIGA